MINIKPPVGRVALIPTKTQTTKNPNRSNKNQYANIFDFIQCLFNGAMAIAPYGFWRK